MTGQDHSAAAGDCYAPRSCPQTDAVGVAIVLAALIIVGALFHWTWNNPENGTEATHAAEQ